MLLFWSFSIYWSCGFHYLQYPMLGDYTDKDKGVELLKGNVVEVLDTELTEKWLVRKSDNKEKVHLVKLPVQSLRLLISIYPVCNKIHSISS